MPANGVNEVDTLQSAIGRILTASGCDRKLDAAAEDGTASADIANTGTVHAMSARILFNRSMSRLPPNRILMF
jgi:hypothetical protein